MHTARTPETCVLSEHLGNTKGDKIIGTSRPPRFPSVLAGGGCELVLFLHKPQEYKNWSHPGRCRQEGRYAIHLCDGSQDRPLLLRPAIPGRLQVWEELPDPTWKQEAGSTACVGGQGWECAPCRVACPVLPHPDLHPQGSPARLPLVTSTCLLLRATWVGALISVCYFIYFLLWNIPKGQYRE